MEDAYILEMGGTQFQDLYLCHCGVSECRPGHSYGPAVRPHYIIHYILCGKGRFQVGDCTYALQQGQGFLIEPGAVTFYKADSQCPWTYLWVAFAGQRAEMYLQDLGLNGAQPVFQSGHGEELREIVLRMLKQDASFRAHQYCLQGLLYEFFAVMARNAQLEGEARKQKESIYVQQAINFVRNNFSRGIGVADMAGHVCISRSYLYKLFQEKLGMSPKQFLTQFRINRSKDLLAVTDLSVEGVALSCGYEDALVYSKTFKKATGMPPSLYRRENRREVQERLLSQEQKIKEIMKHFD